MLYEEFVKLLECIGNKMLEVGKKMLKEDKNKGVS